VGDDGASMAAVTDQPNVVYVLPDKMGGMTNIIANLLAHRRPDGFGYHAVFTHNRLHTETRYGQALAADTQVTVEYTLPIENLHAVMRRVARAVPPGGGVYVAGDLLDLAVASAHDFGRAVVYMLHGDVEYYYDLAVRHDPVVHAFIAYSRRMYDELVARLPHRAETIFHVPYGVALPSAVRRRADGPLRAIYAGRFEQHQKGVFDLPQIDRALQVMGVTVAWTIAGTGPDEDELKRLWAFNSGVRWMGPLTNAALLELYPLHDVFVLPTRFEGFPVALVEAMAAGLPAIVSDIPSGVPEIVDHGVSGERPPVANVRAFAGAIARLDRDRPRLETMSVAARHAVASRFDIRDRVADYQALYARWQELYRPLGAGSHLQYGSRLDRPWIPNPVVRLVRSAIRSAR
jgi:glycosyltransferase involved in cell wall biosynthesis